MAATTTATRVFLCVLVFFCCVEWLNADLSLTTTALVRDRRYYDSTLDNAARAVLRKLSKEKAISNDSRISKVDLDETQVAESVLYSIGVGLDVGAMRGLDYEFQFIQPLSPWHPIRARSLPTTVTPRRPTTALTLHGSAPTYTPPEISLTLRGPLELFFPHATTELNIKTPRYVDVGFVDRVILAPGANITLSGPVELRLRDTLSIDTALSIENGNLVINSKDKPRINVYGHRIEIANADEQLKVQKKYSSVVEISPASSATVYPTSVPLEFPMNDSRIETVKYALQQLGESSGSPSAPKVRRLTSGSRMEAVISFLIPMEVEDEAKGTSTSWDVVVVQGSNHKEAQVISVERKRAHNEVTFAPALAMNRTLDEAVTNFHQYLQSSGRAL